MRRSVTTLLLTVVFVLSAAAAALAQGGATDQYVPPGGEPGGTTGGAAGDTVTLGFRLETEGRPPEEATFFGLYGSPGAAESDFSAVRLTDSDGDGIYEGSVDLEAGETYAARLVQGTGTRETELGTFPGDPTTLLKDFCASGCVTLTEDTTLSASRDFDEPAEEEPETVTATGTLEDPGATSYQYGTHRITDAASDATYALRGAEGVSLERYEDERVIVYGTREPGYPVDGGPELLNVTYVESAGDQSSGEVGTGASAEAETEAFAAAVAVVGGEAGQGEAGQGTFAEAEARALEAAREAGAGGAAAEAAATAAAEAATSDAEPAPESEAVAGTTILPDTGGTAGPGGLVWIGLLSLAGVGVLAGYFLRRPAEESPDRENRATRSIGLALVLLTGTILAVAACSPDDSTGESPDGNGATQGQTEQQTSRPETTRAGTTQAETTQAETTQQEAAASETTRASGGESAAVPEDKTLRLTIPRMSEIEKDEIPTGQGTNENLFRNYAAVHLEGTGFPWQEEANVFIAGHRLGFPDTASNRAFYDLNKLQNGDQVILEDANGKRYEYEVFDQLVVEPKDVYVLEAQEGKNIVSLQTCTLPDYSKRLIVRVELKA